MSVGCRKFLHADGNESQPKFCKPNVRVIRPARSAGVFLYQFQLPW